MIEVGGNWNSLDYWQQNSCDCTNPSCLNVTLCYLVSNMA